MYLGCSSHLHLPHSENLEEHLQNLARDGAQALIGALFALPTVRSDYGPLAQLPPRVYQLPRAKPLPKPKPQTKWEKFAAAKGISHRKKDKRMWDEEKQEWVNRWGKDGKNKQLEEQWITEVPHNAGASRYITLESVGVMLILRLFSQTLIITLNLLLAKNARNG